MFTPDEQALLQRLLDRFLSILPIKRKRKCAHRGCFTILSRYNTSQYCYFHQRLQPLRRAIVAKQKMTKEHKVRISKAMRKWHRRKNEKIARRIHKETQK